MEFAVGVFLNERANHLSLQDDEARRLAEHLVIARKLLTEHPADERHALSLQLTTARRSEERRVGKERVSTGRSRGSRYPYKQTNQNVKQAQSYKRKKYTQ